jgi:hypothetical protein
MVGNDAKTMLNALSDVNNPSLILATTSISDAI